MTAIILELSSARTGGETPHWSRRGACNDDPETQYPTQRDHEGIAAAKSVCSSCDVRSECLTDALHRDERWGVWGGLTSDERLALKSRRRAG